MEAGLPNIMGRLSYWGKTSAPDGGAFVGATNVDYAAPGAGSSIRCWQQDFDASRSNSTYGNSESVNPTSLSAYFFIKF